MQALLLKKKKKKKCACVSVSEWVELFTGVQSRVCFVRGLVLVCVGT